MLPYSEPRWTDEQVAIALYAYGVEIAAEKCSSELLAALARDPVTTFRSRISVADRDTYRATALRLRVAICPDEAGIPCEAGLCGGT